MSIYDMQLDQEEILDMGPDGLHTIAEWRVHLRERASKLVQIETEIARKCIRAKRLKRELESIADELDFMASNPGPVDLAFLKKQGE